MEIEYRNFVSHPCESIWHKGLFLLFLNCQRFLEDRSNHNWWKDKASRKSIWQKWRFPLGCWFCRQRHRQQLHFKNPTQILKGGLPYHTYVTNLRKSTPKIQGSRCCSTVKNALALWGRRATEGNSGSEACNNSTLNGESAATDTIDSA